MARIKVDVTDELVPSDRGGGRVPGVRVTCDECGESATCAGRSQRSVKRAIILLKEEECASDESNYYYDPDLDDRDP